MTATLALGIAALFLLLLAAVCVGLLRRRRLERRAGSLRRMLDLADLLEADLKTCRSGLQQAHAVMSLHPDLPATGEPEAQHAIEAGLRSLLQQRIWIRDRAPAATQQELDATTAAMSDARDRLHPLLNALTQARHEVDDAMREHIRREPDA